MSSGAGTVGSFSAASAKPTNPKGSATTAGKTNRNKVRLFITQILAASPYRGLSLRFAMFLFSPQASQPFERPPFLPSQNVLRAFSKKAYCVNEKGDE